MLASRGDFALITSNRRLRSKAAEATVTFLRMGVYVQLRTATEDFEDFL